MFLNQNSNRYHKVKSKSYLKHSRTFAIIISILFYAVSTFAQESKSDFKDIDVATYQLYMQQEWDSLIDIGKEAIKQGEDYFYLRLRLGMAYFHKGNYRKASQQFEKATIFNAKDAIALEYLFHSYSLSNRSLEARALSQKFPLRLKQKTSTEKEKIFDHIYIETGPTFSNNIENNKKQNLVGQDSIYGEQDLNDDKYYFQAGFGINPLKRVSVYAGYSYLNISKLKQMQGTDTYVAGTVWNPYDSTWIIVNDSIYTQQYNNEYRMIQHQAYLNASISLGKGYILTPAFHLLYMKHKMIEINPVISEFPRFPDDPFPELETTYTLSESDTSVYNYVASLAINKNISLFNFGVYGTYSNLNNLEQYQAGVTIGFYPKGNLNFYFLTSAVSAWENKANRWAFEELIGVKAMNKLWIEGSVLFGEMINYNEKNAYVVYNSGDKIKLRTELNIIVPLSKKIEISVRYQYFLNEGSWFRLNGNYEPQIINSEYQNHTIIGGLTWKL